MEFESFKRHDGKVVIDLEMLKAGAMVDDADRVYHLLYEMGQVPDHKLEDRPQRS